MRSLGFFNTLPKLRDSVGVTKGRAQSHTFNAVAVALEAKQSKVLIEAL